MRIVLNYFVGFILIVAVLSTDNSGQDIWHSYRFNSELQRSELVVENVECNINFSFGFTSTKWKSLETKYVSYAVGINSTKLGIISSQARNNSDTFNTTIKDFGTPLVELVLFEHWNITNNRIESLMAVATSSSNILWYILKNNVLIPLWELPMYTKILHLNYFKLSNKDNLLLITQGVNGTAKVNLYQFDLDSNNQIWLWQRFDLIESTKKSALSIQGPHYYLSIPQHSSGLLVVYKLDKKLNKFTSLRNITAIKITQVVAFEFGSRSFIAADGSNPSIYELKANRIIKQEMADSHLNGINFWLPVKLNNYREDVILLGQRVMDHGLFKSRLIEIITFNGRKFEEHEDIPCTYFGEHFNNLLCLTQEHQSGGIGGTTALNLRNKLVLLVTRMNATILFNFKTASRKIMDPVEREIRILNNTRIKLQAMIDEQKKNIKLPSKKKLNNVDVIVSSQHNTGAAFSNNNTASYKIGNDSLLKADVLDGVVSDIDRLGKELEEMKFKVNKIEENERKSSYENIIVNGAAKIEGNVEVEESRINKIGDEEPEAVLLDIARKDSHQVISGMKTVVDSNIQNLNFARINNISSDQLLFVSNGPIVLNENIIFKAPISAKNLTVELLNDHILEQEVIGSPFKNFGDLEFQQIEVVDNLQVKMVNELPMRKSPLLSSTGERDSSAFDFDTLVIPHNITVNNINGERMKDILEQLCFKNISTYIPGKVTVLDDIFVDQSVDTDFLNDLKFPDEYVFEGSNWPLSITGKKTFANKLSSGEIRMSGTLNGIEPSSIITLSTPQTIPGTMQFENLELTENFEVKGNVSGKYVDNFLSNPTIFQAKTIKANVEFKELEVNGSIVLLNKLNQANFKSVLRDVIYKDEQSTQIFSKKDFPEGLSVRKNLFVRSNAINNVPLTEFMTKNTDQILSIGNLNGVVHIENLYINGLYDGINVTKLDQESVKTTGEQFISSTLVFKDAVKIKNLEIINALGDIPVDQYYSASGDREFDANIEMEELRSENIKIEGKVEGIILQIDLKHFDETRMSLSRDQTISKLYVFDELNVDHFETTMTDEGAREVLDKNFFIDKLVKNINNQKIAIKNLTVAGDLTINMVNGMKMRNMARTNQVPSDKCIDTHLYFENGAYFKSVEIENLSSVNFEAFVRNLVFQNASTVEINSKKIFRNGFTVKHILDIDSLNGIECSNLLRKQEAQVVSGPIQVYGDVIFDRDIQLQKLNDIDIRSFLSIFEMDLDRYMIKDDILFARSSYIYNLQVDGFVEGHNVDNFLNDVIYPGAPGCFLNGTLTFDNNVTIDADLQVLGTINGMNFSDIWEYIVLITEDNMVDNTVIFDSSVLIHEQLILEKNLYTKYLINIDTNQWIENAIFVNKGLLQGDFYFKEIVIKDSLNTNFINNINMSKVIPLDSDQDIFALSLEHVLFLNDVPVGEAVNELSLGYEYNNTFMKNIPQEVVSDLQFTNTVLLANNVTMCGLLNDQQFEKIVTTDTEQTLTAEYHFDTKSTIVSDMIINGTLNGINTTSWSQDLVRLHSKQPQEIRRSWKTSGKIIFEDNVDGKSALNGLDMSKIMDLVEEKKTQIENMNQTLIENYNNICIDINYMSEATKNQIYRFKYFEYMQILDFGEDIDYIHEIKHSGNNYIFVNLKNACEGHLFVLINNSMFYPILGNSEIQIGEITQMIDVRVDSSLYFVTRSQNSLNCSVQGSNIWKFTKGHFVQIAAIDKQDLLQESLVPGTFYGFDKKSRTVTEFKINEGVAIDVIRFRKWYIKEENVAFMPRGLKTGLALKAGSKMIQLHRDEPIVEENDLGVDVESIIIGNTSTTENPIVSNLLDNNFVVMRVGVKSMEKTLFALATHEEMTVKGRLDSIKIYEDVFSGKMFHKVSTYKPSSLVSIEFGNGETLLVFLEDQQVLQVYEYKGIEGFKFRTAAPIGGTALFRIYLPNSFKEDTRKVIGIINKRKLTLIEAILDGNKMEDINCEF